jgi:hypothetical protein
MDPDFLLSLLESMSSMRFSVKKAAQADLSRAAYRKSGVILGDLILQSPANPGLTSWDIFSRPFGTYPVCLSYPGLTSWATLSPYGTEFVNGDLTQTL